ncbi:MAG: hypothetical protein ACLGXA_24960 [Acidobacteriota bacterium]
MSSVRIRSPKVVVVEGDATELLPDTEMATGMHGFVIMVPQDQKGGWLLDMMWRITVAYAALPSLLYSRAKVRTMLEAVMSRESRPVDVAEPRRARVSKKKVARSRTDR